MGQPLSHIHTIKLQRPPFLPVSLCPYSCNNVLDRPTDEEPYVLRLFSFKIFHAAFMFTSWLNIAGRIFASDQTGYLPYSQPALLCCTLPALIHAMLTSAAVIRQLHVLHGTLLQGDQHTLRRQSDDSPSGDPIRLDGWHNTPSHNTPPTPPHRTRTVYVCLCLCLPVRVAVSVCRCRWWIPTIASSPGP